VTPTKRRKRKREKSVSKQSSINSCTDRFGKSKRRGEDNRHNHYVARPAIPKLKVDSTKEIDMERKAEI